MFMKPILFLVLVVSSMTSYSAKEVKQVTNQIKPKVTVDQYLTETKECEVLASVMNLGNEKFSLSILSKRKGKEYFPCLISEADYVSALKILLKKMKSNYSGDKKITEFTMGETNPNPVGYNAMKKMAEASAEDAGFKKILKEGEKTITLNEVFTNIVEKENVFRGFVEIHRRVGVNLEYERVEKVFRQRNSISGAGVIFFKVK